MQIQQNKTQQKKSTIYFMDVNTYSKIYMETLKIQNNSHYTKCKVEGIALLDFKTYYKSTIINTEWYQLKCRHTDQWNRVENPKMTHTNIVNYFFFF